MNRFSSRRQKLDQSFLAGRLRDARAYDRIAGYFSSSIMEVAGEALESITGQVRVVCNSDLDVRDVETAKAAQYGMRREWCGWEPEKYGPASRQRFTRLYDFLRSGKMRVKVLPREKFGLAHGKAGVITLADGRKTSFMGSANETYDAWKLNYEIVWEDDSVDAVGWVQEEFDALWTSIFAVDLADFVIEDVGRLARRTVIPSVEGWKTDANPAAPVIEAPVFRKDYGLWEHQKYFVNLAFDAHRGPFGARFVLADAVGLGKTVQLALAAQLMTLYGGGPVLILAPKSLVWQWQDEMRNLLDMPSAVWDSGQWIDENGIAHPGTGPEGIKKCPRRIGVVSQGIITRPSEAAECLKQLRFECIIVDEAHHARRKNIHPNCANEKADPTNLMAFLFAISSRTRSLMLATATPVQIQPVEAWDLLNLLAVENEFVLGNILSHWRKAPEALGLVLGNLGIPEDDIERWGWFRNPLPPASEGRDWELIRRSLRLGDDTAVALPEAWENMKEPDRQRIRNLSRIFAQNNNPFIRHMVMRRREYLENTIDPETQEPYLRPVKVQLFGESDPEAIGLPPYLREAYTTAEEFCHLLQQRLTASGLLKTLLLKRLGSTIYSGINTALKLAGWQGSSEDDDASESEETVSEQDIKNLTTAERAVLQRLIDALNANQERDPKYGVVWDCLFKRGWLELGCIIFSQYYDSVWWLAGQLTQSLPGEKIGVYAADQKSGLFLEGEFTRVPRDQIRAAVAKGEIRLLLGTDAASEGINLQRLGTLINLDLPWNPTRLEQRKGRLQRIGQLRDVVYVYNMRYKGSVEDRVHELLSDRLENIYQLFGQIPDVLEDVWIHTANGDIEKAKRTIDSLPKQHPFELKYRPIQKVPWETCAEVLDSKERRSYLLRGW